MYHISCDKRSQRSCERICESTLALLGTKEFRKITIADACAASGVSRTTFYRLFDRIEDVLEYQCDLVFDRIAAKAVTAHVRTTKEFIILFLQEWLDQPELLHALAGGNLLYIVHQSRMKHDDPMQDILSDPSIPPEEIDYIANMQMALVSAILKTWQSHGEEESPEQVYDRVTGAIRVLAQHMPAARATLTQRAQP